MSVVADVPLLVGILTFLLIRGVYRIARIGVEMLFPETIEQVPIEVGKFLAQRRFFDVGVGKAQRLLPKEPRRAIAEIVGIPRKEFTHLSPLVPR